MLKFIRTHTESKSSSKSTKSIPKVRPKIEGRSNLAKPIINNIVKVRVTRRLLSHVVESADGCWCWASHKDDKGYGQVWFEGEMRWAHRVFYHLFIGPLHEGLTVHHKCDNPSCVNPCHLKLMSLEDNRRSQAERARINNTYQQDLYDADDAAKASTDIDIPF